MTIINFIGWIFLIYRSLLPSVNSTESILDHKESIGFFISMQANQFSLLQTVLTLFAIGIAIAGVWSYLEIKRVVEEKAIHSINEILPKLSKEMFSKFGKEDLQRMIVDANMELTSKEKPMNFLKEGLVLSQVDPTEIRLPNE